MAGRPRQTLAKVSKLRERAYELADDVWAAMPALYKDRPTRHETCKAWEEAMRGVASAWAKLDALERHLQERVGELPPARRIEEAPFMAGEVASEVGKPRENAA